MLCFFSCNICAPCLPTTFLPTINHIQYSFNTHKVCMTEVSRNTRPWLTFFFKTAGCVSSSETHHSFKSCLLDDGFRDRADRQTLFIHHSICMLFCDIMFYICILFYVLSGVFVSVCGVCLWFSGPPLHCSSGSSSPVASPYPPLAHAASESQGRLLGNSGPRADPDSESEDEFGPASSFLVKTGSGNVSVCAPGSAAADGECFTHRLWQYLRLISVHLHPSFVPCSYLDLLYCIVCYTMVLEAQYFVLYTCIWMGWQ